MKRINFILCFFLVTTASVAQTGQKSDSSWFNKNVSIGQSTTTITNGTKDPAQLQATFPKKDTASYLVNIGIAITLKQTLFIKENITGDFHRNTLTDSAQNNLQLGYSFAWRAGTRNIAKINPDAIQHWIKGDVKYIYDGIAITNSIGADLLYSPRTDQWPLNLNSTTFLNSSKRTSLYISPLAGIQLQEIYAASNDSAKGFVIRPEFTLNAALSFNHLSATEIGKSQSANHPIITISADYTGRWDAYNSTKMHEGYTYLFSAAVNYYIISVPIKVSMGPSFNVGSDPMQGLKQQQYWLFSLNISKFIK
jgi:hypothetical protein